VDAVDAYFHCRFWRKQRFRKTQSQKSAYIEASGASGYCAMRLPPVFLRDGGGLGDLRIRRTTNSPDNPER